MVSSSAVGENKVVYSPDLLGIVPAPWVAHDAKEVGLRTHLVGDECMGAYEKLPSLPSTASPPHQDSSSFSPPRSVDLVGSRAVKRASLRSPVSHIGYGIFLKLLVYVI